MKALVLSGGTGTRLRPLTYSCAKQLLPVANKPILFYILEKIAAAAIKDVGIIVGNTHEEIKAAVGNGERWDVNITYIHQSQPSGLAHAVKAAHQYLGDDDFLMVLGDNMFQMGLDELIQSFYNSGSNASLLLHKVENPEQFGVAVLENRQITRLVEKPEKYIGDLAITGVYIFDKSIFPAINEIKPSARGELEITDAMQKLLDNGGSISYVLTRGWWKDTGKPEDLLEVNRLILDEIKAGPGLIHFGKNVEISNCRIDSPVIIGDDSHVTDCHLGPYVSVGKNVRIENSKIDNSIILDGTTIQNTGKEISGSLIGRNSSINGLSTQSMSVCLILGDSSKICI